MSELIQEFEKTTTFKYFYSTLLEFDESLNCYVATEKWRNKEAELLTAAWWMFQERQATINQLNSVLNERTKEWIQAIECGTYFENVAKPLRVKNDALQKRIDEALFEMQQLSLMLSKDIDGYEDPAQICQSEGVDMGVRILEKALRGGS
ncbi:hypothetical protein [Acinetobacter sp. ANC 5414]|uniref:hypothetical protein n=1 Tax=Acinetobacter sp. ANC 5414 TaxID=2731251 RepID=UPI00148FB25C|nr:hypothetical protein [Acinetobacter sp. ANC 5414]NNH00233.1 hypothetical protein [Acinetobacter sp. ANC 5414]